jgi:Possible lysine decarboxylase
VCVFCGSSIGARGAYADAAASLGRELAARGIGLVYGGAGVGLMRVAAEACRTAGGSVTGVIPESLVEAEVADRDVDDLRIVGTMHERKALMAELAAGFVALPGGFGTLEEFARSSPGASSASTFRPSPARCSTSTASTHRCWSCSTGESARASSGPSTAGSCWRRRIRSACWTCWRPGNRRRRRASGSTTRWRRTAIRPEPQPEARSSSGASGRLRATVKAATSAAAPTVAQRGNRKAPAGRPTSGRSHSASATPRTARNPGRSRL